MNFADVFSIKATKLKKNQSSFAHNPVSHGLGHAAQTSFNNRLIPSSNLLEPIRNDNDSISEHSTHSRPIPIVSNVSLDLRNDDPYHSPLFWTIFTGLLLYTLTSMIEVASYLAWQIGRETYPGIKAGITVAGIMLLAAIGPLYHDLQRLRHFL